MIGLPVVLATRTDWFNAFDYAKSHPEYRNELIAKLQAVLQTKTCKILREGVQKAPQDLTPEDFEEVPDPASPFSKSGLGEEEIITMINALKMEV